MSTSKSDRIRVWNNTRSPVNSVIACAFLVLSSNVSSASTTTSLSATHVTNIGVPSFSVASNGVNPTQLVATGLPPKWNAQLILPDVGVRRYLGWWVQMTYKVPVDPSKGFNHEKSGIALKTSKNYAWGENVKSVNRLISAGFNMSSVQSFAVSVCKTHVDYLRQVQHLTNQEIFSQDRKIPLHWRFHGESTTTQTNPPPAEVHGPDPDATSFVICKKYNPREYHGSYATEQGEMELLQMLTMPAHSLANLQEKCPANVSLSTIVYSNQKGSLNTYVEYKDKAGKITKGPKRQVNTGVANKNTGQVMTEFTDVISLPAAKRVPPAPKPGSGGMPGSFQSPTYDADNGYLPGDNNANNNVHEGAVRVVVKTGATAQVSPGGQSGEDKPKVALASDWIPYKLTCKPDAKPVFGGANGMTMLPGATHNAQPAQLKTAPSINPQPTNGFGTKMPVARPKKPAKPAMKPVTTTAVIGSGINDSPKPTGPKPVVKTATLAYPDVMVSRAAMASRNSLTVSIKNVGDAQATACKIEVSYSARIGSRNKVQAISNINAGQTVTTTVPLVGVRPDSRIAVKAQCGNEPASKQRNNSKTVP